MVAGNIDDVSVAVAVLDGLVWIRLFRSILLGKNGSIAYLGVKDLGVKHEKRFPQGREHLDEYFWRSIENLWWKLVASEFWKVRTYGWSCGRAVYRLFQWFPSD